MTGWEVIAVITSLFVFLRGINREVNNFLSIQKEENSRIFQAINRLENRVIIIETVLKNGRRN